MWSSQQQKVFDEIKEIRRNMTLQYFDPKRIYCATKRDASIASNTLSSPETQHSNIERDMLLCVGSQNNHPYTS